MIRIYQKRNSPSQTNQRRKEYYGNDTFPRKKVGVVGFAKPRDWQSFKAQGPQKF